MARVSVGRKVERREVRARWLSMMRRGAMCSGSVGPIEAENGE